MKSIPISKWFIELQYKSRAVSCPVLFFVGLIRIKLFVIMKGIRIVIFWIKIEVHVYWIKDNAITESWDVVMTKWLDDDDDVDKKIENIVVLNTNYVSLVGSESCSERETLVDMCVLLCF